MVSTILSFLITPFLVNHLGREIYGFYGIANSFVSYITIIAIALNSMAAKYITVEYVRGNELKAQKYYSSVFFSNVILCLILTPILVIIIFNLSIFLNISSDYIKQIQCLFVLIFAAMILRFLTSIYGTVLYTKNRMDYRAYIDLIKAALRLFLYILLFTLFKPSVVYLGVVLFLLELFNSVSQICISKKLMPQFKIRIKLFDLHLIWETLKVGVWNSLNQLGDLLLSSSDLIMSNILLGEMASGNISIIKTIPTLISGVITAINGVFMPRATNQYAQGNKKELILEITNSQKMMCTIITPLVLCLIIFSVDFFNLWIHGDNDILLANLMIIDVSRMLIVASVWPVSNLNIIFDKVKVPSLFVIFSGIVNIISMWGLTAFTDMDIYSIVITTFIITFLFYGLFIPLYSSKNLGVSYFTFVIPEIQMIILALIVFFIVKPIHDLINISTWSLFFFIGGICGIVAVVISVLFYWHRNIYCFIKMKCNK